MAIPDYQTFMLPLLQLCEDGKEHSLREAIGALSDEFNLSSEERTQLLPSGRQAIVANRVGWARTYLVKAGLLRATRRGYFQISEQGREVLQQNLSNITTAYLKEHHSTPELREFLGGNQSRKTTVAQQRQTASEPHTPEEIMETIHQTLKDKLAGDLLQAIKQQPPAFFEQLVIDLLVTMGYGGTRKDAGEAVGRSGDGGVDGIIKEDRLGLDVIYIQAKRWDGNSVGRPEIQKFVGALQERRARKGVFITTSKFTEGAREYAERIGSHIVLIDGDTLAQLMIDYGLGVTTVATYELKRIDADYFAGE